MTRNMAPALVSSKADIVEYRVEDASAVDPLSPPGYVERYIHSEIYKRFPDIKSVLHSHSPAILPFTITGMRFFLRRNGNLYVLTLHADVELRPCVHMGGFLGSYFFHDS